MTITRHRYTHLSCLLFDSQRGALYGKEKKPACHQENTTKTKVQTKGLLDRFPLKSISCCITCCRSSNVNFTWDKILESKKVTRKWSQGPPKNGGGGGRRKTKRKKRKRKKNTHRKWGPREYRHGSHFHSHRWAKKKKKGRDKKKKLTTSRRVSCGSHSLSCALELHCSKAIQSLQIVRAWLLTLLNSNRQPCFAALSVALARDTKSSNDTQQKNKWRSST